MKANPSPFNWFGADAQVVPLLLTCPHSGEVVPLEAPWLAHLDAPTLLTDVDRFVDQLYMPAAEALRVPLLCTNVHRYAADLNRYPEDIDRDSVEGARARSGEFTKGFHWVKTTQNVVLLTQPITAAMHLLLTQKYHDVFHNQIEDKVEALRLRFSGQTIYHFDCHSMPSVGTGAHPDSGKPRPEVCLSDVLGKSASPEFMQLALRAFQTQDFEVSVNAPYQGGRITQRYGKPAQRMETIQIELNRSLYMNELTREKLSTFSETCGRLTRVLTVIFDHLKEMAT